MLEKVKYGNWGDCVKLTNGKMEMVVTVDVGPRVIRCGFVGGQNFFEETPDIKVDIDNGEKWCLYGGHRLWHSPEAYPRSYSPDAEPVKHEWDSKTLKLIQNVEKVNKIAKEVEIILDEKENMAILRHRLINKNIWPVKLAPWCLTVMAKNGRGIIPQEPYIPHPDRLLPARPMVLWHFTQMADPRWTWGNKYVQLRQDPNNKTKTKIGMLNKQGWAAYSLNGEVFIKRYGEDLDARYPDYGCNTETFTVDAFLELETLGPLRVLEPEASLIHEERWYIFKGQVGPNEADIDRDLLPLVQKTR